MKSNWNAEKYSRSSKTQKNHAIPMLNDLDILKFESILDIGSGNGYLTSLIAENNKNASVFGIDNSKNMVEHAQQTYQHQNLTFLQLDAQSMSFDSQFDLALSFSTLHWIQDQKHVFQGIHQALKPNGIFRGFLYPKCDIQCNSLKQITTSSKYHTYFPVFTEPFYGYTEHYYQILLTSLGFKIQKIELTPR